MVATPAMYMIPVPLETAEASRAWKYPDIKGFSALFMQQWSPSPPTKCGHSGQSNTKARLLYIRHTFVLHNPSERTSRIVNYPAYVMITRSSLSFKQIARRVQVLDFVSVLLLIIIIIIKYK